MAQSAEAVKARLAELGGNLLQFVGKEIADLPEMLYDDETIHAVGSGEVDNHSWLLIVTERRILLTYHGSLGGRQDIELPLSQVKSVSCKTGMMFGELLIDTGGQTKKLTKVQKVHARKVAEEVSRLLHAPKPVTPPPTSTPAGDDSLARLERLAALHEKGALTDDEFAAQKQAMLSPTADTAPSAPVTAVVPDPVPAPADPPTPEPESKTPASPEPPQKKGGCVGKFLKIAGGIFVALFVLGLAVDKFVPDKKGAPAPATEQTAPVAPLSAEEQLSKYLAAVKAVDSSITDVQLWNQGNDAKTLGIFYTKDIAFKVFYTIGMNCQSISEELVKKRLIDDKTNVLYFVHVPTVDKLGNSGTGLAMKIEWSGATLQKINWKNMFAPNFMNLCEHVELSHLLRQDFVEFAQNVDNQKEFTDFIRTVLATNKSL